ncbi:MAG: hypothetical protein ACREL7_07770 [Longimicrobiales bacterium]
MKITASVRLLLRSHARRIGFMIAFAAVFLFAAFTVRLLTDTGDGHAELDRLFAFGGPTLASAFLLLGWLVGRFPVIVTLVLMAGFFSQDRADGMARLYLARPVSPIAFYALRFATLAALAFALSASLLPLFDLILLGAWAGAGSFALITAEVMVYGGLVVLLSLFTRADAWVAFLIAVLAMTWHSLRAAGFLDALTPAGRETITFLLPPHGALFAIESAFGDLRPVPWDAFAFACAWGVMMLVLAGVFVGRREV